MNYERTTQHDYKIDDNHGLDNYQADVDHYWVHFKGYLKRYNQWIPKKDHLQADELIRKVRETKDSWLEE